jgi:hypothetical protein
VASDPKPWYHGSPHVLSVLKRGSVITQWADLAVVLSLRPSLVILSDDGKRLLHDGRGRGYLYELVEGVDIDEDIEPVESPLGEGVEWRTLKPFRLKLAANTQHRHEDLLSPEEVKEIRSRGHEE